MTPRQRPLPPFGVMDFLILLILAFILSAPMLLADFLSSGADANFLALFGGR